MPEDVEHHTPKLKRMNKLRSIDLRYFGGVNAVRSLADDTIYNIADSNRTRRTVNELAKGECSGHGGEQRGRLEEDLANW